MDIGVPSRFACLKIEDDEFRPVISKKKPDNKQQKKTSNGAVRKSSAPVASTTEKSKKKKKSKAENEKDWEEWQQRDGKFVNDEFEKEMQNAILQSKLDFEKSSKYRVIKTEPESSRGKKKKGKTMSLDQFLEPNKEQESKGEIATNDSDFFEEVIAFTKKVVTKEKVEQGRKKREEAFEEVISLAQCQEKLETERKKNLVLHQELTEAKKEIALVKKRNTMLCSMLSQGEMKDKAAVLLELERLTVMKEELNEEVSKLHKLLEQERSNKGANVNGDAKHINKEKPKKKKH